MPLTNTASNDAYNEGQALRALRKGAGLSLDNLAAAAGCSPSYLSRFENGDVKPTAKWKRKTLVALVGAMRTAA